MSEVHVNQVSSKGVFKIPKVSIGMPVYNGSKYIREALNALISQSYTDFELIISDNASTDDTEKICREYAVRDERVKYIRQSRNLGGTANFKFVLDKSVGKYFMWAACDDIRSPDFLDLNLTFLEANPEYLGSTSPIKFLGDEFNEVAMGDATLDSENNHDRIVQFFRCWHANGRFYSLFRRSEIINWKNMQTKFLGSDWTLITYLVSKGKLKRISGGWVQLGKEGESNTTNIFAANRASFLDAILPFNKLSIDTWKYMSNASVLQKAILLYRLLRLNFQAFRGQFFVMYHRKTR